MNAHPFPTLVLLDAREAIDLTGLIKISNVPLMKMVTALGWETAARFDYLVLDLGRVDGMAEPRAVQFDLYRDPYLMRLRLAAAQSSHFAPRLICDFSRPHRLYEAAASMDPDPLPLTRVLTSA